MRRRLKFTTLVLVSQMLLIALALVWLLQMYMIAVNHSIYFIENNSLILYAEISVSILIIIYAIFILVSQIRRLGERRNTDRRANDQSR